ncbi:MAG: LPS assembly lipoprotein LptE, partial [Pseudomonadota bacterium]
RFAFQEFQHLFIGQSKQYILVNSSGEADYVLNGRINTMSYTGRAYDAKDRAQALIATLNVDYTATDTRTGKPAWETKGLALTETYSLQTDTHKKQARETLVNNLSEQIYIRLYSAISRHEKNKGREE